ncbi:M81 family metallopeptidase [Georgenia alba]|uniref:M81 family metallopeptidase n=1 Tax=Georgenia alba TaxID=2233858 RepID=A0ABW2QCY8_9MICO
MSSRVGVLGFFHESNTFAGRHVTEADVRAACRHGGAIAAEHAGAGTVVAGYLDAAPKSWETVPLVYVELVPCGPLEPPAAARIEVMLRTAVRDGGPFDALLICLHGSAASTMEPDLDGALLAAIRADVGPDVLLGVTLDLHANVTTRLVDAADVIAGYRTNPHIDARVRAAEVTRAIEGCLEEGVRPSVVDIPVPATVHILAQGTSTAPMAPLMAAVDDAASAEGVLAASLFQGFPWADTPDIGMRVVLTTRGDRTEAEQLAVGIAQQCWGAREDFVPRALSPRDALGALGHGTTLLLDIGDNIGAGAPGNSTRLLHAAIDAGERATVAVLADPRAAVVAAAAGVGAVLELTLGEPPLPVAATVLAISDGRYEDTGPTHVGHRYFDAGTSAALELSTGQHVVVCSRPVMPSSVQQLRALGLHPRDHRLVCAKGVHSPLASYGPHADHVVFVDTPGVTANDLSRLTYRNRPIPLFPFEDPDPALTPRKRTR